MSVVAPICANGVRKRTIAGRKIKESLTTDGHGSTRIKGRRMEAEDLNLPKGTKPTKRSI
jgi:hypothetical protein